MVNNLKAMEYAINGLRICLDIHRFPEVQKEMEGKKGKCKTVYGIPYGTKMLIMQNDIGRSNLYKIASEANLKHDGDVTKVPASFLNGHMEGILIANAATLSLYADNIENIMPIKEEYHPCKIRNADLRLRVFIEEGIQAIYGGRLPDYAKKRLDCELEMINKYHYASHYVLAAELVKESRENGYPIGLRGSVVSSFVAFLTGITNVNPLPKEFGGYDIPWQTFMGTDGRKKPDIEFNIAREFQYKAADIITEIVNPMVNDINVIYVGTSQTDDASQKYPSGIVAVPEGVNIQDYTPLQYAIDENGRKVIVTSFNREVLKRNFDRIVCLNHSTESILADLKRLTNADTEEIDDFDTLLKMGFDDIPELGTEKMKKILSIIKPKDTDDLIRMSALIHGTDTWDNNAKDLITCKTAGLKDVISCRDDIFMFLQRKGIDSALSYKIMEYVRMGKVARGQCESWSEWKNTLLEHNVPEWYVDSCEKIGYLFPRAHCAVYVQQALQIAYYKLHFPETFYSCMKSRIKKA